MDIKNMVVSGAGLLALLLYTSLYTVDQREKAILFKFREIVNADIGPGLHFRLPFINSVSTFPARIQTLTSKPEQFLTGEKKYVTVDFFVKWRIQNVAAFYGATGGGRISDAENRLEQLMKDGRITEKSPDEEIQETISAPPDVMPTPDSEAGPKVVYNFPEASGGNA